jgi:hypothetical protein
MKPTLAATRKPKGLLAHTCMAWLRVSSRLGEVRSQLGNASIVNGACNCRTEAPSMKDQYEVRGRQPYTEPEKAASRLMELDHAVERA